MVLLKAVSKETTKAERHPDFMNINKTLITISGGLATHLHSISIIVKTRISLQVRKFVKIIIINLYYKNVNVKINSHITV